MIKTIKGNLVVLLLAIMLATTAIFFFLIYHNNRITDETASEIGAMYMSEMMYQTQDHFESIVNLKNQEAWHVAQHPIEGGTADPRAALIENAEMFGFDYLAFYEDGGNYETIMGESAWFRNLSGFIEAVKAGEMTTTTGYLTTSGEKYLVFGVPAAYEMQDGSLSSVLFLGFNAEKLYDYIHIEDLEQFGHDTRLDIILTNGSYVLKQVDTSTTNYFEHIVQYGSFSGMETEAGIAQIETAMAGGDFFSHTVTLNGLTKHIYGAPVRNPGDWYFVLSMPQGAIDELLGQQNDRKLFGFGMAGIGIVLLFLLVFLVYLRMSYRQIKETEAAKNDAEIANNAKSSFLSNMSHDIRTPMNAVAGFADIAEESIRNGRPEDALQAIAKMKLSTDYLRSLIGDVLDMGKIESGKLSLIPDTVSFTQTVEMIDTIAKVRAEMKRQEYGFSLGEVLHDSIECDQVRLNQVLINLLGNAVKFTKEGGRVQFKAWQEPSEQGDGFVRARFLVQDNGIGISQDFVGSIFDSFSREESRVRKIEGTGLGLAISKKLVDMMGGTITVDSEEGAGSAFCLTVDFPRAAEAAAAAGNAVMTESEKHVRILLAEDNDFNFEIAQALLDIHGFMVRRAENGQEAVKLYRESPEAFDLILMDLRMPVLDGYEATRQIRSYEAAQSSPLHTPIFALSADVFEEDIRKCAEVGMEGHISKPIDINELLRKIRKY